MKGLYISNLDPTIALGYQSKLIGQIKGLNKLGADLELLSFIDSDKIAIKGYSQNEKSPEVIKLIRIQNKNLLSRRIKLLTSSFERIKETLPDFIYLRYPRSDPFYLLFLRQVKKHCPKTIIFAEIPTYPYDQEYDKKVSLKEKLIIFLDKATRNQLKKYIDRIVVVSYQGRVFDIPSISIANGIDVDNIQTILNLPQSLEKEIHLIAVANVSLWHGYDRIIAGLRDYYQKEITLPKVFLHIVSPVTKTMQELNEIIENSQLSDYIIFHGAQQGEELEKIFQKCQIGIGDLGTHRRGIKQTSALKVREYIARGIPLISSAEDSDISDNFPYLLKIPPDDSSVKIPEIINFAQKIYQDPEFPQKMREFAYVKLDWSIKLREIIEIVKQLRTVNS